MPDTIRQQIMTAIDARLKTILIVNGYETNIGQNVFDWRVEPLEESDLPALIYKDVFCETEIDTFFSFTHKLTIEIVAFVQSSIPMTEIRKIIADIDKAIKVDDTWGNLCILTQRLSDESGVEIKEKKYVGCVMMMAVTFRTQGWDDYTKV